jgi:hypothetical protein
MISAYCVSRKNDMGAPPYIIIPPRGARCVGMFDTTIVITCAKF